MFTPSEREAIRNSILEIARSDERISGGAITGSGSVGKEDEWSDIDLAFGVKSSCSVQGVLSDYTDRMYRGYGVLAHLDVMSGDWIYRVFLLPSTLQVDLAFAPEASFGAKASTFKLLFGDAKELPQAGQVDERLIIGYAWLYALHVRSCIARGKVWQGEWMISQMREQVLKLACLRHGISKVAEGRGMDLLPEEFKESMKHCLVGSLSKQSLMSAFAATIDGLIAEIEYVDVSLRSRLEPTLRELLSSASDTTSK